MGYEGKCIERTRRTFREVLIRAALRIQFIEINYCTEFRQERAYVLAGARYLGPYGMFLGLLLHVFATAISCNTEHSRRVSSEIENHL
jgi:hypothetical protein